MKLKIWNEEEAKNADKDQLFLKLRSCDKHGDIFVSIVDKSGNLILGSDLLVFDFDLRALIILNDVNQAIPLKTDLDNAILCIREDDIRDKANREK